MKVIAAGAGTLVDEVERLLDKATEAKSRTVRLADRAARLYAPVVHTAAALTCIGWLIAGASLHDAIVAAIAVLIITCPCAIALAIPAVQVVAAGQLFRSGIILNSGDAIERLAETDTVVFDKTGTLTLPDPAVDDTGDRPGSASSARRGSRCRAVIRWRPRWRAARGEAHSLSRRGRGAGTRRPRRHRRRRSAARQRGILRLARAAAAGRRRSAMRPSSSLRMPADAAP